MATKVFIENFEIIEKAQLVLDGLVALVGESNNGKTATYNALKVLTYNVQGQGYIRKVGGKKSLGGCRVGVMFEESNISVVFQKLDSPVYTLSTPSGKIILDKAGRGPTPQDIADVLNMGVLDLDGLQVNLNFVDQLSEPLLRKLSDYQLYKIAVKSFDGEKIQEAISLCRTDLDSKSKELQLKENEIEVKKKWRLDVISELEQYQPVFSLKAEFDSYDENCRILPVVESLNSRRGVVLGSLKKVEYSISLLGVFDKVVSSYAKVQAVVNTVAYLEQLLARRKSLTDEISLLESQIHEYSGLDALSGSYSEYTKNVWTLKELLDLNNDRHDILINLEFVSKKVSSIGDINEIISQVSIYSTSLDNLNTCNDLMQKRKRMVSIISGVQRSIDLVSEIDVLPYEDYKSSTHSVGLASVFVERRSVIKEGMEINVEAMSNVDNELTHLQHMLDNNICPTCLQVVKDNNN